MLESYFPYILIALTVLIGAGLTFVSGFGLGTLMLPVFSLFFPLEVAIGATAIVHVSNNIFKFGFVAKDIHFSTWLRFGIPALIFASIGGYFMLYLSVRGTLFTYSILDKTMEVSTLKLVIGCLMVFFAWVDWSPRFSTVEIPAKWLPLGGVLSGFFGGVSGHQGAFRSAFLIKAGLTKEQFIATSSAIALIIDFARIGIYSQTINLQLLSTEKPTLLIGITFAFVGTYFGRQLLKKTTLRSIQKVVGVFLFTLGIMFILGVL